MLSGFYQIKKKLIFNILSSEFYILQRNRICYKCNKITPVYALAFPSFFTVCDMEKTDAMVPISYQDDFFTISSFPDFSDEVLKQINLKYCYKDYSKTVKRSYIANHCCNCNSIQGNYPLFCEEDSPFSLDNIIDDLVNDRTGISARKINLEFDFIANPEYLCIDYSGIIDRIVSF